MRDDADAYSIVAGYHWFGDWGRDTAISLPGLTLATGRFDIARKILTTLAGFVDGGMLPNIMPAGGETPVYNTVDAALWFVEAAGSYLDATGDRATIRAIWPALRQIFESYRDGTRYGIRMDADGLIVAAATGVQLTWMDAKVGDWVVTPRMGKPVEIAALWYNALKRLALMAPAAGELADEYAVVGGTRARRFRAILERERRLLLRRHRRARRQRCNVAAESDLRRFAAELTALPGAATGGRGRLRGATADDQRIANVAIVRSALRPAVWWISARPRCRLPSGNRLAVAARAVRRGARARLWRRRGSALVFGSP